MKMHSYNAFIRKPLTSLILSVSLAVSTGISTSLLAEASADNRILQKESTPQEIAEAFVLISSENLDSTGIAINTPAGIRIITDAMILNSDKPPVFKKVNGEPLKIQNTLILPESGILICNPEKWNGTAFKLNDKASEKSVLYYPDKASQKAEQEAVKLSAFQNGKAELLAVEKHYKSGFAVIDQDSGALSGIYLLRQIDSIYNKEGDLKVNQKNDSKAVLLTNDLLANAAPFETDKFKSDMQIYENLCDLNRLALIIFEDWKSRSPSLSLDAVKLKSKMELSVIPGLSADKYNQYPYMRQIAYDWNRYMRTYPKISNFMKDGLSGIIKRITTRLDIAAKTIETRPLNYTFLKDDIDIMTNENRKVAVELLDTCNKLDEQYKKLLDDASDYEKELKKKEKQKKEEAKQLRG